MVDTNASSAPPAPQDKPIGVIVGALMLVMLLASLDQTIVSTALPTIVGDLGGLAHLSWIVTAYLLASTVVTPLYGKLGDLFGRKVVLQAAVALFLAGSALCGLAHSMVELIVFRGLQGLGGGGLMVTVLAVIGDIIAPIERGRYQGLFGGVFGIATVLGPLIGGFIVEHLSWRWIFYVNLPLGLVAFAVIGWAFTAPPSRERPAIDLGGAGLLALCLTALVLVTSLGGHTLPWGSPASLGLIALTVASLAGFVAVERRTAEPLLPLRLFGNRIFVVCCAIGFIVGLGMFGSVTYMPLYLQIVKGVSPARAGLQLTPMMAGVLVTSLVGGHAISRIGRYRMFPIVGTAVMTVGLVLLSTLGTGSVTWTASAWMLILGLGLGLVMPVLVLAAQNAVDYADLGVATSGTTMVRSIGGAVGVALFGAIFAAGLSAGLAGALPAGATMPAATDPASIAALPAALRAVYLDAVAAALHPVFHWAALIAASAFALSWLLREVPLRDVVGTETIGESFAMPRDATSLEELELIVTRLAQRRHRWRAYRHIADSMGVELAPDCLWLLIRLCLAGTPVAPARLARRHRARRRSVEDVARRLVVEGLAERGADGRLSATPTGRTLFEHIAAEHRRRMAALLERWSPESHPEVRAMLDRLNRALLAELPAAPAGEEG